MNHIRRCSDCKTALPTDTPIIHRICRRCYAAMKRKEEGRLHEIAAEAHWRAKRLEAENAKLKAQVDNPAALLAEAGLDKRMITRLIGLVHPDRHNGSTTANEMTQILLKLRDRF